MQKSGVTNLALGKHKAHAPIDWPEGVEGQIAELCRDLAVQAKQMRQLQEQADELHTMIRRVGRRVCADLARGPANRGERR